MTKVCPRCFNEEGLKKRIEEIRPNFPNEKCTFHPRYKGIPLSAVSSIVDDVFRQHYGFGDYYSVPRPDSERTDHVQEGSELNEIIYDLTEPTDDDITDALILQLIDNDDYWPPDGGEPFYMEDQNYAGYDASYVRHSELWDSFCKSIVHKQRFFNTDAKGLIAEIFDGVQHQRDKQTLSPVYRITPGEPEARFYRARIANDPNKQKAVMDDPEKELGPPPERLRRAGRMNPAGIACLYGGYEFDTCVAELRPAVGSTVVGAQFELIRPLYVLDTTRFEAPMKPMSVFSKHYMQRHEQWTFLQRFRWEIAKPVSPDDEHLDYIPTQAVAEFFLYYYEFYRGGNRAGIEAIIFRSAQCEGGRNIVLLGDAAQICKPSAVNTIQKKVSLAVGSFQEPFDSFLKSQNQPANPGVRLKDNSLKSHRVTSARFESEELHPLGFDDDLDF